MATTRRPAVEPPAASPYHDLRIGDRARHLVLLEAVLAALLARLEQ